MFIMPVRQKEHLAFTNLHRQTFGTLFSEYVQRTSDGNHPAPQEDLEGVDNVLRIIFATRLLILNIAEIADCEDHGDVEEYGCGDHFRVVLLAVFLARAFLAG